MLRGLSRARKGNGRFSERLLRPRRLTWAQTSRRPMVPDVRFRDPPIRRPVADMGRVRRSSPTDPATADLARPVTFELARYRFCLHCQLQ